MIATLTTSWPAAAAEPTETRDAHGGETAIMKEDEEAAGKEAPAEVTAPDGADTEAAVGPGAAETATDATPASDNKDHSKRRASGGVPEHKSKKLSKKKSMASLHLDCKPGEHYWARLKGYPPWPAIVCDEQMLPESLLASRPVSTARPDGSLRDDFKEGGKNAKERTYPIMFLSTNEFSWLVNTALTPLDPSECTGSPKSKQTKALQDAYRLAAENHDITFYKDMLVQWQEEEQRIAKERAELEAEQARLREEEAARAAEATENGEADAEKKKKKAPRKSKGGEDVDMADAEAPKSSKKRKKDAESDGEGVKPKKTPKVTKLNAPKTPNGEASAKKSSAKPKKKVSAPKADEAEEETKPQLTEAEKIQQREKAVLYLRHRLQKGFLSRDQAPQESEMAAMADFFVQLENYENLEPVIIRNTKIHKVLKAIVKLNSIPKDEEYNFKKRSAAMLEIWNKRMESDSGDAAPAAASTSEAKEDAPEKSEAPAVNGDSKEEEPEAKEGAEKGIEEKGEEKVSEEAEKKIDEKTEGQEKTDDTAMTDAELAAAPAADEPVEKPTQAELGNDAKGEAEVGDVSMQTAPEEAMPETAA